ncbi:acyltransferase [Pseudomonas fulva]|uniref:Acetylase n=1 Tax=Pseudomonas parafulva TaxID=157782 RepID=A0AAJ0LK38_9PSED|nr:MULTISPECIES: acyltransferase family protein [Pseudomonas]KTT17861.1 acetylase [Pseudomonas parafulva]MBA5708226.1 acyltransferase [Pseudomonas fulva]
MIQKVPGQSAHGSYYPYIDGLRAFAVLSVVIYHLHAAWLPGGFVGVDVFFVISGFIVSASIANYRSSSFLQFFAFFYARRIKRIFPALIVCLLFTAYMSALFIPSSWLSDVNQRTGLYAFLGLSNFVLASTGRNYFAPTTEFNPYTHTWSLAVEEQFYLVFPILYLAWLGGTHTRWRSSALFGIGLVASIIYSAWQSQVNPTQAFFLSPGRFWELASGVLLYQFISRKPVELTAQSPVQWWRAVLAVVSLAALLVAFWVSRPEHFPMPGALMAVLGTLGLIYSLHHHPELRLMHRLIGSAPMVGIGRISYSLYLWHWPVFVLFRWTYGLDAPAQWMSAVVIAFALAWLSYRFVETPVRQSGAMRKVPQSGIIVGGIAVIGLSCWLAMGINHAAPKLSLSQVAKHADVWYPDGYPLDPNYPGCVAGPDFHLVGGGVMLSYNPLGCQDNRPRNDASVYVIGDSHALAYSSLFKQYAIRHATQINAYNNGGCPFISLQPARDMDNSECRRNTDAALADLRKRIKPGDILFLASLRLPRFADQWAYFGEQAARSQMFGPAAEAGRKRAEDYAVSVLKEFTDIGVRVVFEGPKPLYKAPPFRCADWFDKSNPICAPGFEMPRSMMEAFRAPVLSSYANIAARLPNVEVWDPFPTLCPGDTCSAFDGDKPLFLDGDHLSGHGNMVLLPAFTAFIEPRLGRYPASLEQGIDLGKTGIPDFLTKVSGFSQAESWGRWTDAHLGPVSLTFEQPLPRDFVLQISALAYGPNAGAPVTVSAGGVKRQVVFGADQSTREITFEGVQGNSIEILPPSPISPSALGASSDERLLGLGISRIRVQPSGQYPALQSSRAAAQ